MAYVKIKDKNLVRDTHSKAVLNTDKAALENYRVRREIAKKQQAEQSETKQRLIELEDAMLEMKDLIKQIAMARKG